VSYDLSGSCISSNGKWTATATMRMKLIGMGRDDGATGSVLGKVPS
jgi:hypothetical protein